MDGRSVSPEIIMDDDSCSYIGVVKEVFQDGHANYEEFEKILIDFRARRVQQRYPGAYNFVAKVKERFQGDDIHVYKSFLQKVRMLREGNMSRDEVYHEILTLLQDHQDLVTGFYDFLNNNRKNVSDFALGYLNIRK